LIERFPPFHIESPFLFFSQDLSGGCVHTAHSTIIMEKANEQGMEQVKIMKTKSSRREWMYVCVQASTVEH
jgi:hypothetical protein